MAIRTTASAVEDIIEVESGQSVTPFIEAASAIVDDICDTDDSEYTEARLELIERWLAAHMFACANPRTVQEGVGSVTETKQTKSGLGLDLTHYGQQAKLLDTEGGLAALDQRSKTGKTIKQARVHHVGLDMGNLPQGF